MKRNTFKSDERDKTIRNVKVHCLECGDLLKFRIENDVVVEGDGVVACNIPGALCQDCIDSVLDKVQDPPGLICLRDLNPTLAQEIILNFEFLLPPSEVAKFFVTLFPGNGLVYEAAALRLHFQGS